MKIVHIIPSLNYGGLQKFSIDLTNTLSEEGNEVYLVVLDQDRKKTMKSFCSNKLKLIFIRRNGLKIDVRVFGTLYKAVSEIQPDVVHTHGISLFYSIKLIIAGKIKFIHTVHNLAYKEAGRIRIFINGILFNYFKVQPVSISDEVDDSFQKCYPYSKVIKIYNGLVQPAKTKSFELAYSTIEMFKKSDNTRVLINVGRIDEQKNQKLLISSYLKLREKYKNICLLIIGDLGEDNPLFEEIKIYNDTSGIHFLGVVENVYDYLLCSDIFCLSSKYEGLPISLLEALSAGKICACTPAGGVSSVLSNRLGYVSHDFTIKDYYNTLELALNNTYNISSDTLIRLFNKNYTMDKCCREYMRIYHGKQ